MIDGIDVLALAMAPDAVLHDDWPGSPPPAEPDPIEEPPVATWPAPVDIPRGTSSPVDLNLRRGIDAADLLAIPSDELDDVNPDDAPGYFEADDGPDLFDQIAERQARVVATLGDLARLHPRLRADELATLARPGLQRQGITFKTPTGLLEAAADALAGRGPFAGSIGSRTAADLRHGTPPDQLADPYCTPEGPVVLYARGGTGKGLMTCWLIKRLVATGQVVMVIDFEGHEREWGSRLRGLGLSDDELALVHYRAPFGPDWTAQTGALSAVADLLREDAERQGVTYLVVDSYSVATSNGDTMGGEQAAREYFSGLARIGLPSLTIAHVRGDSGKFPDRPFGSVFVHNLARETWAVERVGEDEPESDPDLIAFGPHIVALELRNKKSNARPLSAAQFVTFSFFDDGTIEATADRPTDRSVADLAADALVEGPLTMAKVRAAIKEDTGRDVSEDAVRKALARDSRRFVPVSGKRPREWSLR